MMMRALTIAGYALCGVAAAVLVVIGQLRPGRLAPLGRLLDRVFTSRAARDEALTGKQRIERSQHEQYVGLIHPQMPSHIEVIDAIVAVIALRPHNRVQLGECSRWNRLIERRPHHGSPTTCRVRVGSAPADSKHLPVALSEPSH